MKPFVLKISGNHLTLGRLNLYEWRRTWARRILASTLLLGILGANTPFVLWAEPAPGREANTSQQSKVSNPGSESSENLVLQDRDIPTVAASPVIQKAEGQAQTAPKSNQAIPTPDTEKPTLRPSSQDKKTGLPKPAGMKPMVAHHRHQSLAKQLPGKVLDGFQLQAMETPTLKGLDNTIPATNSPAAPSSLSSSSASGKTLQGSVSSLRVTRGRSQIIKFAQPIVRVSIAEPNFADIVPLSPDQLMINGKQRGVTSLIVWDEFGQEGIFDLYIENDTSELLEAVKSIAPGENIEARVTDDSFILSGRVSNAVILDEIRRLASAYGYRDENFVDLTETPMPQVVLEVRVAEANRSTIRQLKTSFNSNRSDLSLSRLANDLDSQILQDLNRASAGLVPGSNLQLGPGRATPSAILQAGTNVGGLTGSFSAGSRAFGLAWDLLETNGRITLLAEPKLVCTHGRTADFLAGGEFPYVSGVDQNGSPLISFREFGVKLKFTPWVAVRSGRVELKVEPEVSSLDQANCVIGAAGIQVCGLLVRRSSTVVELGDGESLMLSGILTREESNQFAQIPFVGSLPVIGQLFKNSDKTKRERELVVVVTPRILKPDDQNRYLGKSALLDE
ncbi:MAG: pilus assembly protein N-terminal domain-containing protein [Candidatus Melainabacteria bacterium]|nr:pilus assembly protein N-terminal domain-containing protein [Candidatus Melainabacteria bacterium]